MPTPRGHAFPVKTHVHEDVDMAHLTQRHRYPINPRPLVARLACLASPRLVILSPCRPTVCSPWAKYFCCWPHSRWTTPITIE